MATDTLEHKADMQDGSWGGASRPFKASYGKLMMWYFLLSDAFTFSGFLIAYGTLRATMPSWPVPDFVFQTFPGIEGGGMPLYFVTFMTFVLLFSSFTMVRAVQEGQQENRKGVVIWMLWTIIGGLGFLGCQALEWNGLIAKEHMTVNTNPFGTHTESGIYLDESGKAVGDQFEAGSSYLIHKISTDAHHGEAHGGDHGHGSHYDKPGDYPDAFVDEDGYIHRKYAVNGEGIKYESFGPKSFGALFYFITGFHGFHVFSGIVFLIIIMLNALTGLYAKRKNGYEMVEKIGLYWHFVDLVWVFVFLVFYLL